MLTQFFTIGILMLLSAMLPGPDFALVTKNTLLHSRRAGLFTVLGITIAVIIHMTYCILGLAIVISESMLLFNAIKYIGAVYLIYMGITSLLSKHDGNAASVALKADSRRKLSDFKAFRQGFLCNLLNPKATLFFLALFTVIIKPTTPLSWELFFAVEMLIIIFAWFASLTLLLSHPTVIRGLNKVEKYISNMLGIFLIGFGVALAFISK